MYLGATDGDKKFTIIQTQASIPRQSLQQVCFENSLATFFSNFRNFNTSAVAIFVQLSWCLGS